MVQVNRSNTGRLIDYNAVGQVSIAGPEVSSWGQYSYQDGIAYGVFLTPITFNQSGVLFAYIVHCRNSSPVRLQVWRPTNSMTTSYMLACQTRVVPDIQQLHRRAVVSCSFIESTTFTLQRCIPLVLFLHNAHRGVPNWGIK